MSTISSRRPDFGDSLAVDLCSCTPSRATRGLLTRVESSDYVKEAAMSCACERAGKPKCAHCKEGNHKACTHFGGCK